MGSRNQASGTMYPRVKVQGRPDPKSFQEETTNLLLKVIESVSQGDHYPSNVPASTHGISSARPFNLPTSSVCNGLEGRGKKSLDRDNKLEDAIIYPVIDNEMCATSPHKISHLCYLVTGSDYKSDTPSPCSGISTARLSNLSTSSVCNGSEGRNKKSLDRDKKPKIRASSVPRPRAVLSSPDNDGMIGHQNRLLWEKERPSKGQTLRGSAAGQCKPTPRSVRVQSPANKRETTGVPSNDTRPKPKPSLIHENPRRQTPAKVRPNPAWI